MLFEIRQTIECIPWENVTVDKYIIYVIIKLIECK